MDEWAGDVGGETERLLARVSRRLTPREASLFLAHARGATETELASSHGYSSAGRVRFRLNRIRWHIAESFPDDAEVAELLTRRAAG